MENTGKPTNSTGESKSVTVKTNLPKVPKQKGSLHDRNLQAANLMMLRKEKAALEYAIQKNQFSKTDLTTKKDLLRRIDEELVRRNQKPQKASTSTMTKETKTKAPLTRDERDLKDLGKEPFTTLKTKLNDKHTNNK